MACVFRRITKGLLKATHYEILWLTWHAYAICPTRQDNGFQVPMSRPRPLSGLGITMVGAPLFTGAQCCCASSVFWRQFIPCFSAPTCCSLILRSVFVASKGLLCCWLSVNSFQGGGLDPCDCSLSTHTRTSLCWLVRHSLPLLVCWVSMPVQAFNELSDLGHTIYWNLSFPICKIRKMVIPSL